MVSAQVTLALALAFVAVVNAAPGGPGVYAKDYYAYPKYSYSYGVKDALTGDQKSAHETRDGGVVKGSYSLVQPDGVLRTVNYVAGPHTGFQAEVINSAPAVHAVKKVVTPVAAVAPVYGHGYGHGLGHGLGYGHVAPVAKAVVAEPLGYGHGYGGHGYGHGYAAPIAVAKPVAAAVSYSHGIGPVVGGHVGGIGYGHGGGHLGGIGAYGHHAALGLAGHGGYGHAGGFGGGLGYGGGLGHGGFY